MGQVVVEGFEVLLNVVASGTTIFVNDDEGDNTVKRDAVDVSSYKRRK